MLEIPIWVKRTIKGDYPISLLKFIHAKWSDDYKAPIH